MKLLPLVVMLIAFGVDIVTSFLYGTTALSFSFWLVIFYLLGFWSTLYNAWLYRTNSEKWAKYATVFAIIFSVLLGSATGLLGAVLARLHTGPPSGTYESWLAGFFLTCSIAWVIASADYWKPR